MEKAIKSLFCIAKAFMSFVCVFGVVICNLLREQGDRCKQGP